MTDDGDLGLFGPDSVSWRVHTEPILWVAGVRALYLQALHPRAVTAVVQNSDYRADPWGRLGRTAKYVGTAVFGTTAAAQEAGRRLREVHERLTAVDQRTSEVYRIDDPHLLRWVHVTEVDSFVTTATRAGLALTPDEVDGYLFEQRRVAALVGLDPATVPGTAAEVRAYYRAMRPELALTTDGIRAAGFMAAPPLPYGLGLTPLRIGYTSLIALAVALLPPWARRLYGLPGLPTTDVFASLSARALRRVLTAIPGGLLEGPTYRAAKARAAARREAPPVSRRVPPDPGPEPAA